MDAKEESLEGRIGTFPFCTNDRVLGRAKMIRKFLNPEKTVSLIALQAAVAKCLGRDRHTVLSEPQAIPVYPEGLNDAEERRIFQRKREIEVLTHILPAVPLEDIKRFVDKWGLVIWRMPDDTMSESGDVVDPPSASRSKRRNERIGSSASTVVPELIDTERVVMADSPGSQLIPPFMPPSVDFASQKARDLLLLVDSLSESMAQHVTALAYGYADWKHFEATFKLESRSLFDSELAEEALLDRMCCQLDVLERVLEMDDSRVMQIHHHWAPTAQQQISSRHTGTAGETAQATSPVVVKRLTGRLTLRQNQA